MPFVNDENRKASIERMHREKQERIARQIALKEARETVMASPATVIKDPEVIAHKVTRVADIYLRWIQRTQEDGCDRFQDSVTTVTPISRKEVRS